MTVLRRSRGEVTGPPLPAQPVIVAIHMHRRGDLATAQHCLSGLVRKVFVMPEAKRTQVHSEALRHLSRGAVVLMAPEGAHSWASQVHRLDVEVARLALDGHVLVVPGHVVAGQLHMGAPVDVSRHESTPHSHAVLRAAADDVALALCALTGLPYQDYPVAQVDRRLRPIAWLSRMRKRRHERKMRRQVAQTRSQQENARDAEEFAREEERARRAAQLQARRASLADRLAERDLHPGE